MLRIHPDNPQKLHRAAPLLLEACRAAIVACEVRKSYPGSTYDKMENDLENLLRHVVAVAEGK